MLSENVVNRMKEPSSPPPAPASSTFGLQDGNLRAPHKESTLPRSGSSGGQQPSGMKEGVKRYEQEHAAVQDKLFQVAKREREAATKHSKASLPTGEGSISHEEQKSVRLQARELESREAELRRRDTFYKEQLERIERKNAEMYKLSSQQFHEAASKMESTIKTHMLKSHSQRDDIRRWGLCKVIRSWEWRPHGWDSCPYKRDSRELPFLFYHVEDTERRHHL
ncbi:MICOS complex subunit MIC25 isoform X7 [Gorilla gorilla gorilla]|nr:MICOS complex subunit MIC25 isoform X7 [Gorilla gorilla gorilla]